MVVLVVVHNRVAAISTVGAIAKKKSAHVNTVFPAPLTLFFVILTDLNHSGGQNVAFVANGGLLHEFVIGHIFPFTVAGAH
jgi:hypothetical protein